MGLCVFIYQGYQSWGFLLWVALVEMKCLLPSYFPQMSFPVGYSTFVYVPLSVFLAERKLFWLLTYQHTALWFLVVFVPGNSLLPTGHVWRVKPNRRHSTNYLTHGCDQLHDKEQLTEGKSGEFSSQSVTRGEYETRNRRQIAIAPEVRK